MKTLAFLAMVAAALVVSPVAADSAKIVSVTGDVTLNTLVARSGASLGEASEVVCGKNAKAVLSLNDVGTLRLAERSAVSVTRLDKGCRIELVRGSAEVTLPGKHSIELEAGQKLVLRTGREAVRVESEAGNIVVRRDRAYTLVKAGEDSSFASKAAVVGSDIRLRWSNLTLSVPAVSFEKNTKGHIEAKAARPSRRSRASSRR